MEETNRGKQVDKKERSSNIKCFKCLGQGHMANQCPNRNTMLILDNIDITSDHEEETKEELESEEEEMVPTTDGEPLLQPDYHSTCPYGTFAFRRMPFGLCNAPATFQRCMTAIFSDLNEDCLEIFMDDFSTFGENFDNCLSNLEKVLKRCKETNLVLNWEKCHFMVDEGIVLGHKISSKGMEVDKAKIEVISKLPSSTTVKGICSFLGHAGFYRRFIEDFSKITNHYALS
ncbi:hypothetical protein GQ457_16G022310 [Hibiscus cannabinus]